MLIHVFRLQTRLDLALERTVQGKRVISIGPIAMPGERLPCEPSSSASNLKHRGLAHSLNNDMACDTCSQRSTIAARKPDENA
jgi:hypothetical protein